MSWRPIADSGVPFEFANLGGDVSISGSTVAAPFGLSPSWRVSFGDGSTDYPIRVTVLDYQSTMQFIEDPSYFDFTTVADGVVTVTNGNTGTTSEFTPNPVAGTGRKVEYFAGIGSETTRSESYSMLVEVDGPDACQEHGRVTRAYVSGYSRTRVHDSKLYPNEKRCLVANFNGALPAGRTIVQAEWRMDVQNSVSMANAEIAGREARVLITAAYRGEAMLRCEVTLDNGEVYNQLFRVCVLPGPWFGDERTAVGPLVLVATA